MSIFSAPLPTRSSSSSSLFPSVQNPYPSKCHHFNFRSCRSPPLSSKRSPSTPLLQEKTQSSKLLDKNGEIAEVRSDKESIANLLAVRRPAMFSGEDGDSDRTQEAEEVSFPIDVRLTEMAKKMPIFEPESVDSSPSERIKPLMVNLDLALYRSKLLARNFRFDEAATVLQKCIYYWPEDGRPYVALGKILSKQLKTAEARALYEKGCQATQGENPYIWQCWAMLESKVGNIRRARELFDAATVADEKHIAAWHGWAVLELKQGNIKKARNLLNRGLKFCGGNEYVYQTLALLEAKANRYDQARYLFMQATKCNSKSCASWLAWAQLEMQRENINAARQLFEKAVQASPKNRFAWHIWGLFEANLENIDLSRKLLKIGHKVNPRDPVLLQSLALLEYKTSTANLARLLFKRASELDPKHQPVWIAWGWMEWKEGNLSTARELYQKALSIDSTTESAARCLQAWGVLEQRVGNLSAARRLLRSSLSINAQSYVTWMTWASLEEDQGNFARAEEIRNLYFQQRTEVVDDTSWVMGFFDIFDPALDSIKRFLNLDDNSSYKANDSTNTSASSEGENSFQSPFSYINGKNMESGFDLDAFVREKLSLDPSDLQVNLEDLQKPRERKTSSLRKVWISDRRAVAAP